jgi:hypothetical protein
MLFYWLQGNQAEEGAGVQLGELSSSQRTRPTVFPTLHHSPTSISLHVRHVSLHNPLSAPYICLCSLIKVIGWKRKRSARRSSIRVQLPSIFKQIGQLFCPAPKNTISINSTELLCFFRNTSISYKAQIWKVSDTVWIFSLKYFQDVNYIHALIRVKIGPDLKHLAWALIS